MHVRINFNEEEDRFIKDLELDAAEVIAIMNSEIIRLNGSDLKSISKTFAWSEGLSTLIIDCELMNNE